MSAPTRPPESPESPARARRWLLPAVLLVGVALHLPALTMGFYADDYPHQLALEGHGPLRPWALYDFGEVADWRPFEGEGWGFPWWTSPDWKIRFFRPLASLSLWLDHAVWGGSAAGYHVTSLLWYVALLLAAHAAYRSLGLGRGVAIAGVALLAVSQSTAFPTGWIANRNSLQSACFTALAVAAAAASVRSGRRRALVLAFASAVAACLSKESGVVAFVLVGATLLLRRGPEPRPAARGAAVAALACAAVFVVALASAGFGTRSLFYATPWSDPDRYVANLGRLFSVGSASLFTPFPSDLLFAAPEAAPVAIGVSVVVVVPFAVWARRRLRGDGTAALLAIWTFVAMAPEGGAPLQDRLLLSANVGAAGLLAMLLARTLPRASGRGRLERGVAWAVVALAGVLEAVACAGQSANLARSAADVRRKVVGADVGAPGLGRREVLLLQSDDPLVAFAMAGTWAFETRDLDLGVSLLQAGRRGLRWTREDERTFVFESTDRPFVRDPFETVYRSRPEPPAVGTVLRVPSFEAEVLATTDDGGVARVRLRFPTPPDGERFRFLVPRDGRLTHVPPPAPGETIVLPPAPRANPFVP